MRPIELEYVQQHWSRYQAGVSILVAAAVACVCVLAIQTFNGAELKNQEKQWQSSQYKDGVGNADSKSSPEKSERLKPELKRANEIVQQLSLPWDGLFTAIEVFDPNQVALLRIETDVSRHSLTITAEAKNFNAMLGYVQNMGKKKNLSNVYLIDHQILMEDALKPVKFSISAGWVVE